MRSTNFTSLDLSDYEISPEQGFLPKDPLEHLPDLPTLTQLGREMPKLLSARTVRRFIDEQRRCFPPFLRHGVWRTIEPRCGSFHSPAMPTSGKCRTSRLHAPPPTRAAMV